MFKSCEVLQSAIGDARTIQIKVLQTAKPRDVRKTFYGWADVWRDPDFERWDIRDEYLPGVRCPVLAIQGHDDEYGTMVQLDEIARRVSGPCELLKLENCGHSPFRDRPQETLAAITEFIR